MMYRFQISREGRMCCASNNINNLCDACKRVARATAPAVTSVAAPVAAMRAASNPVPAPPDFAAAIRAAHPQVLGAEPVLSAAAGATPEAMFAAGIRAAQEARS